MTTTEQPSNAGTGAEPDLTLTALGLTNLPPERQDCDLIMKGGITSGIVYPQAILGLKRQGYRFHCIGGTSAGAIAAVAAAAAEYRRWADAANPYDGYLGLARLNASLCQDHKLRDLFQPSRRTRVLMEVASQAFQADPPGTTRSKPVRVGAKVAGVVGALAKYTPVELGAGALAGAAVGEGLFRAAGGTADWGRHGPLLALAALAGAAAGGGWALLHKLFVAVPKNGYGLCSGHSKKTADLPIIDWLIEQIEGIGGKKEGPLTFAELKRPEIDIELKLMTTNLSEEMPYVLPFKEGTGFLFCEEEMTDLFPKPIMKYLVDNDRRLEVRPGTSSPANPKDSHYYFLPAADDMPIVVPMRMSLSFPILLSAVPLYKLNMAGAVKWKQGRALTTDDLTRHLFSDGGLCSNFPVHFFDSWLPTRPTFGIDLTPLPTGMFDPGEDGSAGKETIKKQHLTSHPEAAPAPPDSAPPAAPPTRVVLPKPNVVPVRTVNPVTSLAGFLGAIVSTMQNYRDNQQAELPSYRERIVEVRLAKNEGGLNLDMPSQTLRDVAGYGSEAAKALEDGFRLPAHQWTRLLVLMSQMEEELLEMDARLTDGRFPAERLLNDQRANGFPFQNLDPGWCRSVQERLDGIQALVSGLNQEAAPVTLPAWSPRVFQDDNLAPPASLRITPRLSDRDATAGTPPSSSPLGD